MINRMIFNNPDIHDKYDTPYGAVYFNQVSKHNTIRLSGGFDSAVMLYFLAKSLSQFRDDAIIEPITIQRGNPNEHEKWDRVYIVPYAEKIIEYVREHFPNVTITDTIVENANYWWVAENVNGANISSYTTSQETIANYLRWRHRKRIQNIETLNERFYIEYNGVTRNPPAGCIEQSEESHRDLLDDRELFENSATVCHDTRLYWNYCYMPWRNADKRIVFWMAEQEGILDDMLKLTRSCEGDKWDSEDFTRECNSCWWCWERTWAHQNFKNLEITHD